jgi:hypothetical protein
VKYMLIIYGNQELWNSVSPDEQQRLFEAFDAFNKKYYDTGELLGAYGVADAAATKLVRLADGQPAITDGPYLETKEYLASWYLIDVDSEQRAVEIAAALPSAGHQPTEVWPILHEASRDAGVVIGVV